MFSKIIFTLLITYVLSNKIITKPSFGKYNNSRNLNVFDEDNRVILTKYHIEKFPFRTIGRLFIPVLNSDGKNTGSQYMCTATLISRDLILTNKHCTGFQESVKLPDDFWKNSVFKLGYMKDGSFLAESNLVKIRWSEKSYIDYRLNDWTIFQLDLALGDEYGNLGILETKPSYFEKTRYGSLVGYSYDLNGDAGAHVNCKSKGLSVIREDYELVQHDCDATKGSSGGAFYNPEYYIIGLNFGERRGGDDVPSLRGVDFSDNTANLMIATISFYDDILEALKWNPRPAYPDEKNIKVIDNTPNKPITKEDDSISSTPIESFSDSEPESNNTSKKYNSLLLTILIIKYILY